MKIVSSNSKFQVTAGQALYSFLIGLVLLLMLNSYFSWKIVTDYKSYIYALAIVDLISLFLLSFYYEDKYESFSGNLLEDLNFTENGIHVGSEFIALKEIKKLEIKCDDFLSKPKRINRKLVTSPNLSMGVHNYVIIHFVNTEIQREFNFQLIDPNEITEYTRAFQTYIEKGKLDKSFLLPHLLG